MSLLLIAVLLLFGAPPQHKSAQHACDHAAPPPGMRWVCSPDNSCDCHLEREASENPDNDNEDAGPEVPAPAVQCIACRINYFVVPEYPAAARKAEKQGTVSALLILTAEGAVQEVRITSGDPDLGQAARAAFQKWRFAPGGRTENIPIYVKFALSQNPAVTGTSLLNLVVTATPQRP